MEHRFDLATIKSGLNPQPHDHYIKSKWWNDESVSVVCVSSLPQNIDTFSVELFLLVAYTFSLSLSISPLLFLCCPLFPLYLLTAVFQWRIYYIFDSLKMNWNGKQYRMRKNSMFSSFSKESNHLVTLAYMYSVCLYFFSICIWNIYIVISYMSTSQSTSPI